MSTYDQVALRIPPTLQVISVVHCDTLPHIFKASALETGKET
jgi:hypothetical protein